MTGSQAQYVSNRAAALARVILTRRADVQVISMTTDSDLDYLVSISPSPDLGTKGVANFGVRVWGTSQALPDEGAAAQYASAKWRMVKEKPDYFFPVLALLFSMENDAGYYAWTTKPLLGEQNGSPRLERPKRLDWTIINRRSMDTIVAEVSSWYSALAPILLSGD